MSAVHCPQHGADLGPYHLQFIGASLALAEGYGGPRASRAGILLQVQGLKG